MWKRETEGLQASGWLLLEVEMCELEGLMSGLVCQQQIVHGGVITGNELVT